MEAPRTWSVFDRFVRPRPPRGWGRLATWIDHGRAYGEARRGALRSLVAEWDAHLKPIGGEPTLTDWSTFRPLRMHREEAWSDWLAQFIETSASGVLASLMLRRVGFSREEHYARPNRVTREEVVGDRRPDLVIEWSAGAMTQVEVKVGDTQFHKTVDTAHALERAYPGRSWTHFLLVPPAHASLAADACEPSGIHVITWEDITVALRHALWRGVEDVRWRTWAVGFCGVIEQCLLEHPRMASTDGLLRDIPGCWRQMAIMTRARSNG